MAVQFDEQEYTSTNQANVPEGRQGVITNLIMKLGLAKDAGQANIVMLVIALIAVGLSVFLIFF